MARGSKASSMAKRRLSQREDQCQLLLSIHECLEGLGKPARGKGAGTQVPMNLEDAFLLRKANFRMELSSATETEETYRTGMRGQLSITL